MKWWKVKFDRSEWQKPGWFLGCNNIVWDEFYSIYTCRGNDVISEKKFHKIRYKMTSAQIFQGYFGLFHSREPSSSLVQKWSEPSISNDCRKNPKDSGLVILVAILRTTLPNPGIRISLLLSSVLNFKQRDFMKCRLFWSSINLCFLPLLWSELRCF